MIRAFAFPRASLAVSMVLREFLSSLPAIGVMFVMIVVIPPHEAPSMSWWLFPLVLALQILLSLGFVFCFGWLGAVVPDLAQAMSFVSRLLMYASAVIFPIERFLEHPTILAIIQANPIYVVLDMYRSILIAGVVPEASDWLRLAAWAVGTVVVGFSLFWWNEERYARE
jgi:teichoic acid transport system permease protein